MLASGIANTSSPALTSNAWLIASVNGSNTTTFLDNNMGQGLWQGKVYCYMVTAVFADGAESYASEEVCDDLVHGIPVITNVSVEKTQQTGGELFVRWTKPTEFDLTIAPGPYKYYVYRSPDFWGNDFTLIDSLFGINNTVYYVECKSFISA